MTWHDDQDDEDQADEALPAESFAPIDRMLEDMFSNHLKPPSRKRESRASFRLTDWTKDR